jgi:phosphohistidine phosphatase SixA
MSAALPLVYVVRHGETAWSLSGQHTGRTDVPLTARGEAQARAIRARLQRASFANVFTSPSQRAMRTAELAALAGRPRSISIWPNGIMASMRAAAPLRSSPSARIGDCSATVAREEKLRPKWG